MNIEYFNGNILLSDNQFLKNHAFIPSAIFSNSPLASNKNYDENFFIKEVEGERDEAEKYL